MTDTLAPPHPIVIAGGGIGGLASALALARKGLASVVLERRRDFGDDGAGIQIGPNGARILASLGVAPLLEPHAASPDAIRIRDAATARDLATFPLGRWIAARHGAPYWTAHRRDLHTALHTAAARESLVEIRTGVEVVDMRDGPETATSITTDGAAIAGDAVIAADGAWSALRTRVFSGATPTYTGKCAVRTVLPATEVPDALRTNDVHLWLGANVHVVHYPVSAGAAVALVAIFDDGRAAGDWNAPCDRAWVEARTRNFAAPLKDLLNRPDDWRRWSLLTLETPPEMASGRTALLGDAAHPILPFFAQGGAMALEDAVVLAEALATHPSDTPRGLSEYANARQPRVARVAAASKKNGRIYHMSGLMAAARNLALSTVPPARFMRSYDWLYGWSPSSLKR